MRIAYVGNFSRPWCTEVHVAAALNKLGHQVVRLQENRTNLDQQTRALLGAARPGRPAHDPPGLFIWTRTWGVDPRQAAAMFDQLAAAGVPIVSFHLDRYLGIEREGMVDSEPFFRTDLLFTPDSGDWAAHGVNAHWMPPGVDADEANKVYAPNPKRWPWKVALVGSFPYPHPDWHPRRAAVVAHLRATYGSDFAVLPADVQGRPIRNADLGELYATVPVLVGDSCWAGMEDDPGGYWSDRVPETLGRGGYLIHPHSKMLAAMYPDLALYPLGDLDDLTRQIDRALEYPELRQADAAASRKLVLERDTYAHRMAELVEMSTGLTPTPRPHVPAERGHLRSVPSGAPRVTESPEPGVGAQTVNKVVTGTYRPKRLRHTFTWAEGVSDSYAVKEVWDNDDYKMAELGLPGATVIDIGANLGAFAVLAAMLGARDVRAYEPHPDTFRALEQNVQGSRVAGRITPVNAAVGGWARSDWLTGDGGGAHLADQTLTDLAARADEGREVAVLDVDSVLASVQGEVVLKLDCEGAEYEIIDGLTDLGLGRVKTLVMEWHGPGMPHLAHLDLARWGPMVQRLADHGRLTIHGHPRMGGLLWCRRY